MPDNVPEVISGKSIRGAPLTRREGDTCYMEKPISKNRRQKNANKQKKTDKNPPNDHRNVRKSEKRQPHPDIAVITAHETLPLFRRFSEFINGFARFKRAIHNLEYFFNGFAKIFQRYIDGGA